MKKVNVLKVQQLVEKIDSCKNPREARSWLHNLRCAVKETGFGKLPENMAESVYRIEEARGDSDKRVGKMGAFVEGFDERSNDYSTLVNGIKSGLYTSGDVSRVFNRQIDTSLYNCAQDRFDGSTSWDYPQHYFAGLISQGVISQDRVNQAVSKQQLTKLQKGLGYDSSKIQMGLETGHLNIGDIARAVLGALKTRDTRSQTIEDYITRHPDILWLLSASKNSKEEDIPNFYTKYEEENNINLENIIIGKEKEKLNLSFFETKKFL